MSHPLLGFEYVFSFNLQTTLGSRSCFTHFPDEELKCRVFKLHGQQEVELKFKARGVRLQSLPSFLLRHQPNWNEVIA